MRARILAIYGGLIAANLGAWAWALVAFRDYPVLLGTALLAYGFGLRHAVDADHIAAIDNVTRTLMQAGKRPVGVGLFFSLGHSTVVVVASVGIALAANVFKDEMEIFHGIGGVIGTIVSSAFLLAIAAMNLGILIAVRRTFRRVRAGEAVDADEMNGLLAGGGVLARIFRPMFRLIRHSWQMFPLGLLFGLGFDTATEVGLLGIAAAEGSHGLPVWSILVFPALFTAGMSLVDTTDSVLMVGAYGWAFVKPVRKLYYNMTITFASVLVAVLVGMTEALSLIGEQLELHGTFWAAVSALNDHFGLIGYVIIGVFVMTWACSVILYRARGYDRPNEDDLSGTV